MRIIACLGVFIVHFGQRTSISGLLRTLTDFGRYGVQLFLIISGFLAAKGLYGKKVSYIQYYLKRAIHILPLYLFSIIWFFITENLLDVYLHQIPVDAYGLNWLRYILFLNAFVNSDTYFWSNLGITWTIPLFVWFYLLFPVIIKRMSGIRSASAISLGIFFITKGLSHFYQCDFLSYFWIFFLGVVSYYATKFESEISYSITFQILAIGSLIFGYREYAYCFVFTSILLLCVSIEQKIVLSKKTIDIINFLDKRTYTLYLIHGIVFCSLIDRLGVFAVSNYFKGIIAIAVSAIGTLLIYKFYEMPIQRWLTKRLIKRDNMNK